MHYPWMYKDIFSSGNGGVYKELRVARLDDMYHDTGHIQRSSQPANKNYISFSFFPVILRPSDGYNRRDKSWH